MTHLSDDNVGLEVVAFSDGVNDFYFRSNTARNAVLSQLFFPDVVPPSVVVVLPVDHQSCLVGLKPSDDIAPTLVVVHPNGDSDALALVRQETKNARRAATTLGEGVGPVGLGPSATVSIVPDGVFNDVEEPTSGVSLVDVEGNLVRHGDA